MKTHHVRDAVRDGRARYQGRLPQNHVMNLDLVLPVRDQAGLDSFVADIYNPASPNYRHFQTPQQFTERFGPSEDDYNTVVQFAQSHGLTVTGGSRNGMDVHVRGPVSAVEGAFHVKMQSYRHPTENRDFYSPDQEPTTSLPFKLWHVSGMDNYSIPFPMVVERSVSSNAAQAAPNATGSGPYGLFLGSDTRKAYYGSGSLRGEGQNLGIWSYSGTDLNDLKAYYANIGQTYPGDAITLLSTDGTSVDCPSVACNDAEPTLDLAMALGMAPGLANVTMYVGSDDTVIAAAMTTNDPLPATISCSWGWTPTDPEELEPYLQRMAAQGQTFFAASGDYATWVPGWPPAWPSDDPYVTSVGGTVLTANPGGSWQSETAWSASGGGVSPNNIPIPSWQQIPGVINASNLGSTTLRNGPDVAAIASDFYLVDNAGWTDVVGTSGATPVWAGYMALVNQQLAANGQPLIGFLNPTIYQMNSTDPASYSAGFHDIASGYAGSYQAVTGYDLVTGWGSPTPALVDTLVAAPPDFSLAASGTLVVAPGNSGRTTVSIITSGGFSSAVNLEATNLPDGVTVEFSPPSVTGSGTSQATFTVASTAALGTHTITITGIGGALSRTATVNIIVGVAPDFSLVADPASLMVMPSASGSSTISISAVGGFSSPVYLSASGPPAGTGSVSFAPAEISGTETSQVTFTMASVDTIGTIYPITITGTDGTHTRSTTVNVTVGSSVPDFGIGTVATLTVMPGFSKNLSVWSTVVNGFSSAIALSATGLPAGATVTFAPESISGSGTSQAAFTVPSNAAMGTYTVTIKGTSGDLTRSTTILLYVTTVDFELSASPETLAVMPGNSGSSTVSFIAGNGFTSTVALQASGQPFGVTVSLPSSVTGTQTFPVTFTVADTVTAGTYPITISGIGGNFWRDTTINLVIGQQPQADFSITASPGTLAVLPGDKGSSTVTIGAIEGFSSEVDLSAAGLPDGVTAGFSPPSVTGSGISQAAFTVAPTAALGTYTITIVGTGGGLSRSTKMSFTVGQAPDFSIAAEPVSLTMAPGTSRTSVISLATAGGFSSDVSVMATGMPDGVTVTCPVFGNVYNGQTMGATIAVMSTVAPGMYPITLTGTGGGLSRSTTVYLAVGTPGFTLVAPSSLTVAPGNSGNSLVSLITANGFSSSVGLSAANLPDGVTMTFGPALIGGNETSLVNVTVASSVAAGTYSVTITGSSGGESSSTVMNLTVGVAPDFSFASSPPALTVAQGSSGSTTLSIMAANGFSPAFGYGTWDMPASITLNVFPSGSELNGITTQLAVFSVPSDTPTGTYPITITGISGDLAHSITVMLTVIPPPNFSLTAAPSSLTVTQGSSASSTVSISAISGSPTVVLSAAGQPAGVTVGFAPPSVSGSGTSQATFTAASDATPGTYAITITGNSGGVSRATTINLTVSQAPDFALAAVPPLTVTQGSSASSTVSISAVGGFSSKVTLSAAGQPAGVTVGFAPASVSGSGTSQATFTAVSDATPGTYTITITGNGGGVSRSTTVALTIASAAPATPEFTVSPAAATQTATVSSAGGTAKYTIDVAAVNGTGFNSPVTLSVTAGLPSGAGWSFNPVSVTPGSSSVLTVTVPKATASVRGAGKVPFIFALLMMPLMLARRKNRRLLNLFVIVLALGAVAAMAGCGGSSPPGEPPPVARTYTITVTGSSGGLTTSTTVTLVQN